VHREIHQGPERIRRGLCEMKAGSASDENPLMIPGVFVSKKPIEIGVVQHIQAMTPIFGLTVNLT
jgi:hypothetical protein